MSRIAKKPLLIPADVTVSVTADSVIAKGKLGEFTVEINSKVKVTMADNALNIQGDDGAQNGTAVVLIKNAMIGVSKGFEKKLKLVGVGYRAKMQGKDLDLSLGFSHPVTFTPPAGVKITIVNPTNITIQGINKQLVGQVAADIRRFREPEPYKGKGVRYSDEVIKLKETKKK